MYTRWGNSTCPNVPRTERTYSGIVGGSHYTHDGGAANYLCLPLDPEYTLPFQSGIQGMHIYGAEYQGPVRGTHDHNVPCSVCLVVSRSIALMIPAKTNTGPKSTRDISCLVITPINAQCSNVLTKDKSRCLEVIRILMVLCSIMLKLTVILVYPALPTITIKKSTVLSAQSKEQ